MDSPAAGGAVAGVVGSPAGWGAVGVEFVNSWSVVVVVAAGGPGGAAGSAPAGDVGAEPALDGSAVGGWLAAAEGSWVVSDVTCVTWVSVALGPLGLAG